jgi:hypothetical protein
MTIGTLVAALPVMTGIAPLIVSQSSTSLTSAAPPKHERRNRDTAA